MAQRRSNRFGLAWIVNILLAIAAGFLAWNYTQGLGAPAPLGTPLPEVPPQYEILPSDQLADSSLVDRRVARELLPMLAAQPDGMPPLRYEIECEMADFQIRHPYGAQTVAFPFEEVMQDKTLIQAEILFDQPLKSLKYTAEIRREGEPVAEYAQRLKESLAADGAHIYPESNPLTIDDYRLENFEYRRKSEEGGPELSHFVYIGSLGKRQALVLNYITEPEFHEQARPGVRKIVESFVPGWEMLKHDKEGREGESVESTEDGGGS